MTPFFRRLLLRRLPSVCALCVGLLQTSRADDLAPPELAPPAAPQVPAQGVALSARGQAMDAFSLDVWKLEKERIREIRATRHNPTERGMWYSTRSKQEKIGRKLSDAQFPLVGAQMAFLALQGEDGRGAALAGVKAVMVTGLITMGIKKTFLRRRPYPNDNKFGTFPSGHTSTTFAMAGIFAAAQPGLRVPVMLAASSVGWSRVKVRAHHWNDVLAGAALGLVVSNQFKPAKLKSSRLADFHFRF